MSELPYPLDSTTKEHRDFIEIKMEPMPIFKHKQGTNQKPPSTQFSKYKGVKPGRFGGWKASVGTLVFGRHLTEIAAAIDYDREVVKYFGREGTWLNRDHFLEVRRPEGPTPPGAL